MSYNLRYTEKQISYIEKNIYSPTNTLFQPVRLIYIHTENGYCWREQKKYLFPEYLNRMT